MNACINEWSYATLTLEVTTHTSRGEFPVMGQVTSWPNATFATHTDSTQWALVQARYGPSMQRARANPRGQFARSHLYCVDNGQTTDMCTRHSYVREWSRAMVRIFTIVYWSSYIYWFLQRRDWACARGCVFITGIKQQARLCI